MEDKSKPIIFDCSFRLRENPIRHRENVRIGCGAGFGGDRPAAALKLLQRVPNLDYLVLECLAERTLAIRYDIMMSGGHGYDPRISEWMSVLLPPAVERGVRIITNMGAMDALGAQEEVLRIAKRQSLAITVAVVHEVFPTQAGLASSTASANFPSGGTSTYLGADPIVRVLEVSQPHVIITTRLADASLFLGPMVYELGWNWNSFLELSQGTLAGHLLECGCQVTGGYYMHPADQHREFSFQQLLDTSLPFADITFDGNVCIAKAENSGGQLNFSTCAQQLLYEVGDPNAYVTPNVVVNFGNVSFVSLSKDKILAKGAEPSFHKYPARLLQLVPEEHGWKAWGEISYGGLGCIKRAAAADYLVRSWMEEGLPGTQDRILSYIIGVDSLHAHPFDIDPISTTQTMDIRLRMDGLFDLKEHAIHFTKEFEALYTNGPAGGGGISTGYKKEILLKKQLVPREDIFWGFDIKQSEPGNGLPLKHGSADFERLRPSATPTNYLASASGLPVEPAPGGQRISLYRVAHGRAGDKGNDLNFSVIPHFPADFERLKKVITSEWVKDVTRVLMAPNAINMARHAEALEFEGRKAFKAKGKWLPKDDEHLMVEIYEAKGINSLNVVVRNVLDGGVNCSRRIDRHGKTISDLILCQEIVLPP